MIAGNGFGKIFLPIISGNNEDNFLSYRVSHLARRMIDNYPFHSLK